MMAPICRGEILYISDVNYGIYILSHVLILDLFFNYSFFKIHLFYCKEVDPISKHVRGYK
jgi:hypothetical protein